MKAEISTVGIIGGGQLGMFLAQACQKIGLATHIYSDTDDAPAKKYANEGACQFLFFEGREPPRLSYADKKGKYMKQKGVTLPRL